MKTVGAFPKLQMALQNQHVNGEGSREEVETWGFTEAHLLMPLSTDLRRVSEAPCRTLWGRSFSAADLVLCLCLEPGVTVICSGATSWAEVV